MRGACKQKGGFAEGSLCLGVRDRVTEEVGGMERSKYEDEDTT